MIRQLEVGDADAYLRLRREALRDSPLAFVSSADDDLVSSAEAAREQLRKAPDSVLLGAFEPDLIGAVGLYRDRHIKAAHKAHLWGMYVSPTFRRRGIAAGLLRAAVDYARSMPGVSWVQLSVSDAAPEARRLYERAGFETWGEERDALRHGGAAAGQHHMALQILR
jgi:ribosomal protein S18 acetylase RimI-like enzyme